VMLHPGIRTAAAVAGWLGLAALVYDEASGLWNKPDPSFATPSETGEYAILVYGTSSGWQSSKESACRVAVSYGAPYGSYSHVEGDYCFYNDTRYGLSQKLIASRPKTCPSGWYISSAGCVQKPPPITLSPEQAVEELTKHPMPADVPRHIPEPLPVELPEYQPMFIPTG
ncbi:hypothetical protein N7340_18780, partial [Comamonas aquatica]|uniref:hypothetical protein n=1 Tax=Comamonas aquatica TaxID=225991 RepID=UPI00244BE27C